MRTIDIAIIGQILDHKRCTLGRVASKYFIDYSTIHESTTIIKARNDNCTDTQI
jgi:hypothetical protein